MWRHQNRVTRSHAHFPWSLNIDVLWWRHNILESPRYVVICHQRATHSYLEIKIQKKELEAIESYAVCNGTEVEDIIINLKRKENDMNSQFYGIEYNSLLFIIIKLWQQFGAQNIFVLSVNHISKKIKSFKSKWLMTHDKSRWVSIGKLYYINMYMYS